ncbi:uncharacterized protein [Halyomorpha halys]|uniref:uncharacterized protein n=1 Tax=Halyomorpha halys TaxID=286706 RepID=UPI0006D51D63|nr:uncharacterized protein LOC106684981 [Halyomorpha halys]
MASVCHIVLAVFLVFVTVKGESDKVQTQIVYSQQSKPHEFIPAAIPTQSAEALKKEGNTYPSANSVVHVPTKVPAFTSGSPRNSVEGRRSRRGILRRIALPLLILLGIKAGLAIPAIFGAVALAAFKGLWTGSSALMMTAAMAMKNMIPPPKIIIPNGSAHVQDFISADYRRADPFYRDDYSRYGGYGYK